MNLEENNAIKEILFDLVSKVEEDLTSEQNIEIDQVELKYNDCVNITSVFKMNYGSIDIRFKKRPPPNYFLCIRLTNNDIIKLVEECQFQILKEDNQLKKAMVKIETLHITLFALHLKDNHELAELKRKLSLNRENIFAKFNTHLPITFHGLANFRNEVVYIDLVKDDYYKQLISFQNSLVKLFENWGLSLNETKNFTPHMTLMKLSKSKDFRRKGIKKIDKTTYENIIYTQTNFGVELVDKIHLCNIREKQQDGFYKTESSIEFTSRTSD